MAFLTGCSAENPDQGNDAPADEADYTKRADAAACGDKKFSCDDLLEAAFPGPDKYPGQKQNVSAAVAGCCDEELAAKPFGSAHRWACCANASPDAGAGVAMACTPWGPPVPPAMTRKRSPALLEVA